MKIRETSYFPSWIGRQTKLKPTNRAHILDIFNTYYGNRVKSDSIVVHRGSYKRWLKMKDRFKTSQLSRLISSLVLQQNLKTMRSEKDFSRATI